MALSLPTLGNELYVPPVEQVVTPWTGELWNNIKGPGKRSVSGEGTSAYTDYTNLPVQMVERPTSYHMLIEMPGFTEIEVSIVQAGKVLQIQGKKKDLHDEGATREHIHHHLER